MNIVNFKKSKIRLLSIIFLSTILSSCNEEFPFECPIVFLEQVTDQNQNQFTFVVTIAGDDTDFQIEWVLDSVPVIIEEGINGNIEERTFFPQDLEPGEHVVEINYTFPNCPQSLNRAIEFTVLADINPNCENLFFVYRMATDSALDYIFNANFEGRDEIDYDWVIDNTLIESVLVEDPNRNHRLNYTFPPQQGTYNVCARSRKSTCGENFSFCADVSVNPFALCPAIDRFEEELINASNNQYQITLFLDEDLNADYKWEINDIEVPSSEEITISPREFSVITNLQTGNNIIEFFPRNPGCPEFISANYEIFIP